MLSKAVAARILSNGAAKAAAKAAAAGGEDAGLAMSELGEAALPKAAAELGIPVTAKLAGAAGGTILAIGVGFAIDAIEGSIARSKLQGKIRQNIPLRTTQKVNELQVAKLQEQVAAHLAALTMMQQLGYDKSKLEDLTTLTIKKFQPEMEQINETTANQELTRLDLARGSWTNEDN